MKNDSYNDSHISQGGAEKPAAPIKQHHRMALGEKVTGQSNPNGAERGSTDHRIGNARKTY